jgi:general secretion pathway protein H
MKSNQRLHQKGFSLLEIMIVILIIGVGAASIRLATINDDPMEDVLKTANAFSFWFGNQQDQVLLSNTENGLYFTETGVVLLSWREGIEEDNEDEIVWEVQSEVEYSTSVDDLDVQLTLDLESQQWIDLEPTIPENPADLAAHIILFPSEEYQPSFLLTFSRDSYTDQSIQLLGDGFNPVKVTRETN